MSYLSALFLPDDYGLWIGNKDNLAAGRAFSILLYSKFSTDNFEAHTGNSWLVTHLVKRKKRK